MVGAWQELEVAHTSQPWQGQWDAAACRWADQGALVHVGGEGKQGVRRGSGERDAGGVADAKQGKPG